MNEKTHFCYVIFFRWKFESDFYVLMFWGFAENALLSFHSFKFGTVQLSQNQIYIFAKKWKENEKWSKFCRLVKTGQNNFLNKFSMENSLMGLQERKKQ